MPMGIVTIQYIHVCPYSVFPLPVWHLVSRFFLSTAYNMAYRQVSNIRGTLVGS